jgi:hypothetical protein
MKNRIPAILAILAAIVVVAFIMLLLTDLCFFSLCPSRTLPEMCELSSGFSCKDYRLLDSPITSKDSIMFTLQNGHGYGMMVKRVTVTGIGDNHNLICDNNTFLTGPTWKGQVGLHIENGESAVIIIPCGNSLNGLVGSGKKKFNVNISWYPAEDLNTWNPPGNSALIQTINGRMLANVQTE